MLFYPLPDDSLNQLQSIRESLMQMKSPTNQNFSALNTMVSGEMGGGNVELNSITQICPPTDEQLEAVLVVSVAARPGDQRIGRQQLLAESDVRLEHGPKEVVDGH